MSVALIPYCDFCGGIAFGSTRKHIEDFWSQVAIAALLTHLKDAHWCEFP